MNVIMKLGMVRTEYCLNGRWVADMTGRVTDGISKGLIKCLPVFLLSFVVFLWRELFVAERVAPPQLLNLRRLSSCLR